MSQLLPSPGVTQLLNFSGARVHSPSGCILPLCVSHFISVPLSDFQHPDCSWCQAALPALVGEGAGYLMSSLYAAAGTRPGAQPPWSLCRFQGPYRPSAISSLSVFQCLLQFVAFKLHISWDPIGCSLCFSEDPPGVPLVGRGK